VSRPAISDPMIGAVIGDRYEVVRRIAKGGMGTIYEVRNTRLGRSFALKMLSSEAAEDPDNLKRFQREADVIAKLRHPNIVEVVDWDSLDDGSPYLVMEYLRGEPLATRLRGQRGLPWPVIQAIGDQVLSALSVAHAAGVIHRDLKPDNIFLAHDDAGHEHTKLLDFGISKLRDSKTFATTDARVLGTPAYMAPEQAEGRHDLIGPSTDIWSLGAILYEMATGTVAFSAPSTPAILYRVCHGAPDPLLELRPDASAAFVALIERTLMREIGERPSSVDALRGELRTALEPGAPRATPFPSAAPVTPAVTATVVDAQRPRRWPGVVAGTALVVSAAVAVFLFVRSEDGTSAPTRAAAAPEQPAPIQPTPPPAPAEAPTVNVQIDSSPQGAVIYRLPKGLRVGVTPLAAPFPHEEGLADFELRKPGFENATISIDLRTGGAVAPKLVPVVPRRRVPAAPPPSREPTTPARRKGTPVNPFGG
jgi:tRNA A-37 threonylcarbamoyl transferase component Bud32